MVMCCNVNCNHLWFHYSCLDLLTKPEGDWFCSDACRDSEGYVYCTCGRKEGGEMVRCQRDENCTRQEWYHVACLPDHLKPKDGMIGATHI